MKTRNRYLGLIFSICFAALLLSGASVFAQQEQFNYFVPDAEESFTAEDGSNWEQVNMAGFGNADNFSVVAMAKYQDRLYAMTRNEAAGTEVWRTNGTGWEQVLFPGDLTNGMYGNKYLDNVWGKIIEFNGKLYFGISSGLQGTLLGSTGCEIWRYDGSTWEPVISDEKGFNDAGSITDISSCAKDDGDYKAFITDTTQNWSSNEWAGSILRITSGSGQYRKFYILGNTVDTLTIQQFEQAGTGASLDVSTEWTQCAEKTYSNFYPKYSYTLGAVVSGDDYEIHTGDDTSGFGDPWNKTITDMLVHEGTLYVSTGLNYEYGAQVWYTTDGDSWQVTGSSLPTAGDHNFHSFGNFHTLANYPDGLKPISTSITNLAVFDGMLYAGATGSTGNMGKCARMARLTGGGGELIVDGTIDENTTGTNENGFGDGMGCEMETGNFMPWSLAVFGDKLHAGINSLGGARVLYSLSASDEDIDFTGGDTWKYSVGGDSSLPLGFDGETFDVNGSPNYKNIAMNLFAYRDTLYAGIVTQYVPEYGYVDLQGAGIWQSQDGSTWSRVTGNSFGDTDVVQFEAFADYGGSLYVSGSKGASSSPAGLGGAKIFRRTECVTVEEDLSLADKFERFTVTGITSPVPDPETDPYPPGFTGASFLRAGDLDGDGTKEIVVTSVTGESGSAWTSDGAVAVFKRTSGDLSTWTQSVIRADFAWANDILIRDVDADGKVDIMVFDNFLGGAYTGYPAGIYMLRNLGGDITAPGNWEKVTIYSKDPEEAGIDAYEKAKRRASYHQAYFVDLDGDGHEDFVTTRIAMEIWQARDTAPLLYQQQYMWTEWFRAETNLETYPTGFSGPYDIGDGIGFLLNVYDVDDDGLLDVIGPQFFITNPGSLVVKDPGDPDGDSLVWFKNPGQSVLAAQAASPPGTPYPSWERFTIDNWYTSPNPVGKGFMIFPADITNDGSDELIVTTHNHQEYYEATATGVSSRIWPSGVYYLSVPDDPYDSANWEPIPIDAGDAYLIDRPGGPLSQGSPGNAAVGDITGNGLADMVVAGDGRGSTYYYEAAEADGVCSLKFKRAALYDDPASMPAEVKLYDMDNDGELEILGTVYDTSVAKDSSHGSVFIWKLLPCEDTDGDAICDDVDNCPDDSNPAQEDVDGNGTGDVCDANTIYGYIKDIEEAAIEDVQVVIVRVSCGTEIVVAASTNALGYYAYGGLDSGYTYFISANKTLHSFAPVRGKATMPQEVIQSYDFIGTEE